MDRRIEALEAKVVQLAARIAVLESDGIARPPAPTSAAAARPAPAQQQQQLSATQVVFVLDTSAPTTLGQVARELSQRLATETGIRAAIVQIGTTNWPPAERHRIAVFLSFHATPRSPSASEYTAALDQVRGHFDTVIPMALRLSAPVSPEPTTPSLHLPNVITPPGSNYTAANLFANTERVLYTPTASNLQAASVGRINATSWGWLVETLRAELSSFGGK